MLYHAFLTFACVTNTSNVYTNDTCIRVDPSTCVRRWPHIAPVSARDATVRYNERKVKVPPFNLRWTDVFPFISFPYVYSSGFYYTLQGDRIVTSALLQASKLTSTRVDYDDDTFRQLQVFIEHEYSMDRLSMPTCAQGTNTRFAFDYCPSGLHDLQSAENWIKNHCFKTHWIKFSIVESVLYVSFSFTQPNAWANNAAFVDNSGKMCAMPFFEGRVHCGYLRQAVEALYLATSGDCSRLDTMVQVDGVDRIVFHSVSQGTGVIPIFVLLFERFMRDRHAFDVYRRVPIRIYLMSPIPMGDATFVEAFPYTEETRVFAHANDDFTMLISGILGLSHLDAQSVVNYDLGYCTGRWKECAAECRPDAPMRCLMLLLITTGVPHSLPWKDMLTVEYEDVHETTYTYSWEWFMQYFVRSEKHTSCIRDLMRTHLYADMCVNADWSWFDAAADVVSARVQRWVNSLPPTMSWIAC